jgi:predicted NUDIX family phosphoesterase
MAESVLAVPRKFLFPPHQESVQGFAAGTAETLLESVRDHGLFVPREEAESDPSLKQIIPYAVIFWGRRVFVMKRGRGGGEARLHDRVTLGVGGHVNPGDAEGAGLDAAVHAGFRRELAEEVVIECGHSSRIIGLLNDDSNPVGQVHYGVVYRVDLEAPRVRVRETEILDGELAEPEALGRHEDRMETWSKILKAHFWPR